MFYSRSGNCARVSRSLIERAVPGSRSMNPRAASVLINLLLITARGRAIVVAITLAGARRTGPVYAGRGGPRVPGGEISSPVALTALRPSMRPLSGSVIQASKRNMDLEDPLETSA
jgi:hypothetical protein